MERRRRVSPSMIVAGIALVVALTGTGVAAVLVTSSQIADETILSRDVKNGSLQSADIRDGSVLSADIKNGTVGKGDLSSALQSQLAREVVLTEAPIAGFPATLANQFSSSASTALSSTTTRPGRLWIDARFNADMACPSSLYAWFYLMVDGTPVRSSLVRAVMDASVVAGGATEDRHLTGVTAARLPAGTHSISLGIQCSSGTASGAGMSTAGRRQTVIVLE